MIEKLKRLHSPYAIWRVTEYVWEFDQETCRHCGQRVEDSLGIGCIHDFSDEDDIICTMDGPEYIVCEHCYDLGDSYAEYPCATMEIILEGNNE